MADELEIKFSEPITKANCPECSDTALYWLATGRHLAWFCPGCHSEGRKDPDKSHKKQDG